MTTSITTRRTLAHQPTAPVARPPVTATFVAPVAPQPERPHVISTEVWGYVATFLVGAFVGAWLMGLGLWIVH
jgi:hypothetical protein